MNNVSEAKMRQQERDLKKFQEEIKKQEKELRENPNLLGAAIAKQIRLDNHANEDPNDYTNGLMHWFQGMWGSFRVAMDTFEKIETPIKIGWRGHETTNHEYFKVTCATTGCIAGHGASMAGFTLLYHAPYNLEEDSTKEDVIQYLDFNDATLVSVDDCLDPDTKEVKAISDVAAELLNLDGTQKEWLFDACRQQDDVLWALDEIAAKNYNWHPDTWVYRDLDDHSEYDEYEDSDDEDWSENLTV